MIDEQINPHRWTVALLRSLVRPSDSESIPGDLLEEYREVRRPSLGQFRADMWYLKHVLSVLWRIVWPFIIALTALRILSFPLPRGWNPSIVQAPGVSLLDAVILLWSGYYSSHRTGRLSTGIITAITTTLVGFTIFFAYAALINPGLLWIPFEKPFIFVIFLTLLLIDLGFAAVAGAIGAFLGWWSPTAAREVRMTLR